MLNRLALGLWFSLSLCGCAPLLNEEQIATTQDMTRITIEGGPGLNHRIYLRGAPLQAQRVHVYLEGDGLPWRTRHQVAADPGPWNPLALRLMARDPAPSIYLGRPCYHGLAGSPSCTPWLWTHGRYSETVVSSMALAIERILPDDPPRLTLIGYSGGGVLAMLLAERLKTVDTVITIAANLDLDAWADHHGYSRLRDSLNPASRPPLDPAIRRVHLFGAEDREVAAQISARTRAHDPLAQVRILAGFNHRCCWIEQWPSFLAE